MRESEATGTRECRRQDAAGAGGGTGKEGADRRVRRIEITMCVDQPVLVRAKRLSARAGEASRNPMLRGGRADL
jgi:hypothetical protein